MQLIGEKFSSHAEFLCVRGEKFDCWYLLLIFIKKDFFFFFLIDPLGAAKEETWVKKGSFKEDSFVADWTYSKQFHFLTGRELGNVCPSPYLII